MKEITLSDLKSEVALIKIEQHEKYSDYKISDKTLKEYDEAYKLKGTEKVLNLKNW